MKILVQKSSDRDCIGITNALYGTGRHNISLWVPDEEPITDGYDLYIFTDPSTLGFETAKACKKATSLFFKCQTPELFKGSVSIDTIPHCADTYRYPQATQKKDYRCDIFYLANFQDRTQELSRINLDKTFRIAGGIYMQLPNYIGRIEYPYEFSEMALSAGVCIDFDLESAIDLVKIGARVITSVENDLDIPVFTLDNINEVILETLSQKKPIVNKYDWILPYSHLLTQINQLLGVEC